MNFSFIQITDHHLTASEAELSRGFSTRYAFRTVLRHMAQNIGERADFIISTGDLVENASESAYRSFLAMVGARGPLTAVPGPLLVSAEGFQDFPMYLLPGNYDDRHNFFKCLFPQSPPASCRLTTAWSRSRMVSSLPKSLKYHCRKWNTVVYRFVA